jgi:phosphoglycolate phosphatase
MLCEQASLNPEDCIVVGDTTSDSGMARNAGAGLCIGVLTGSGTATQLMETGANVILPHVGDIPDLLQQMGMAPVEKQGDITTDLAQNTRPRIVSQ